jgi:protein TonB
MKNIFLVMSLLITFSSLKAQTDTEGEIEPYTVKTDTTITGEVFTIVEQMPEFPGGEKALNDFISKNLKYPQMAIENGVQGKVWMGFIVGKDGTVSNIEVVRGIGGGCDQEALRVLKLMPKWNPGKQSGRPVIVKFRIPINFTIK